MSHPSMPDANPVGELTDPAMEALDPVMEAPDEP